MDETKGTFENPWVVEAERILQAGYEVYSGPCPRCGITHALAGAGKGFCRCHQGTWFEFRDKSKES